jgi:hypothetical protein
MNFRGCDRLRNWSRGCDALARCRICLFLNKFLVRIAHVSFLLLMLLLVNYHLLCGQTIVGLLPIDPSLNLVLLSFSGNATLQSASHKVSG